MRPGAGDGAVKMVSAGLGRKLGLGVAADALTENRIAFEVEPFGVVLDEDVLGAPLPVDELSHSTSPAQSHTPYGMSVVITISATSAPARAASCESTASRSVAGRSRARASLRPAPAGPRRCRAP